MAFGKNQRGNFYKKKYRNNSFKKFNKPLKKQSPSQEAYLEYVKLLKQKKYYEKIQKQQRKEKALREASADIRRALSVIRENSYGGGYGGYGGNYGHSGGQIKSKGHGADPRLIPGLVRQKKSRRY